jgi:hypothetical protein
MNILGLRRAMAELRVRSQAVGIDGLNLSDEQYRIEQRGFSWAVYYSERGKEVELHEFPSEHEVCNYLLRLLDRDKTTRLPE